MKKLKENVMGFEPLCHICELDKQMW